MGKKLPYLLITTIFPPIILQFVTTFAATKLKNKTK